MSINSNYNSTIKYLFGLESSGIKFGLKNIQALLDYSGNPENHFPSIHVAGTNGKGSTSAMIASVLTASGYKTALYTSPHLTDFAERIRIDGVKISWDKIVSYTKDIKPEIEKCKATFFEATTAIAFRYFADMKVDIAVIETGLGGRLDSTNVLTPIVSVITNIGIEHEQYLGSTYKKIAFEKGGIIKPFTPCITAVENSDALSTIEAIVKSNRAKLFQIDKYSKSRIISSSIFGLEINVKTKYNFYDNLSVSLPGEYQLKNSLMAIIALEYCKQNENFKLISEKSFRKGFSNIQAFTGMKGRCEVISPNPLVIGDVAHNPDAMKSLVRSLKKLITKKIVLVFGVMRDKNYSLMIDHLKPITKMAYAVQPKGERALNKFIIQKEFQKRNIPCKIAKNCHLGLKTAIAEISEKEPILVTGSHYVLSEIIQKNE
ncbi:MAG: bifunctional folylpolyglutamate synthase/dihydrofolate synthase [Ignavibacteriales bacterium]|nr:bifunctional folylpolyglutamate synthase/dihydrofolate synthase [Ignavibacteriales bacterium]